nr:MAG TPA: hypothetical protein [Caudoviricetes sp.]
MYIFFTLIFTLIEHKNQPPQTHKSPRRLI